MAWVQLALTSNFVQLHQFLLCPQSQLCVAVQILSSFYSSDFILAIAFVSSYIYQNQDLAQVITWK